MTTHSLAISRDLASAGIEKKHADAIASALATHADETYATKADIARLEGKMEVLSSEIKSLTERVKLLTNLVIGLYIGLALLLVDRITS